MISTDTLYRLLTQASTHETIRVQGNKFAEILKELIEYRKKKENPFDSLFGGYPFR